MNIRRRLQQQRDQSVSDTVIRVENLGKRYIIGHQKQERYTALRDVIANKAKGLTRLVNPNAKVERSDVEEFWALKDVSFEVKQGDRVGIIGRNGAGKSTLLKILSRITEPTEGRVKIKGRVASLLEVGTGFHPELTGRENIYLNGAILGMGKQEIRRKFDEIVAFAEVEKFLDTPVKRYSSGMYVRLAFAVAAHLEPEILIVDEVLAVGDAAFQKKCIGKMKDVGEQGRTVLFVSHNMQAITSLTHKCLVFSKGSIEYEGDTSKSIACYLQQNQRSDLSYFNQYSSCDPKIQKITLYTSETGNIQFHGDSMKIEIVVQCPYAINGARIALKICDNLQQPVLYGWRYASEAPFLDAAGSYSIYCHIPKLRLYQGRYSLTVIFAEKFRGRHFERMENVCRFEVIMFGKSREGGLHPDEGKYIEDCIWNVDREV